MKYEIVKKFDDTGLLKTIMVKKDQARFRIYSHNILADMEDLKYYNELGDIFNITPDDMIRIPQNHSSNILVATKKDAGLGVTRMEMDGDCDGIITNEKRLLLITIESDCTPVFIFDPKNMAIGMIHSGWRGTVNKITEKALDLMNKNYGTKKEEVLIYFGPSICGKCYEVGIELIDEFKKILVCDEIHKVFTPMVEKPEKYLLDVTLSLKLSLLKYGVKEENIFASEYCTYHSDVFDSWRLNHDKSRQMLTGIMLV